MPIPPAYPYYNIVPAYNARPGMPALTPTYIAVAAPGGALDVSGSSIASGASGSNSKVTPLKTFQILTEDGDTSGTLVFYYNEPRVVPTWLRTKLVALGLVS